MIGTRPEAIKMAPVVLALRHRRWAELTVLATGQHRHLLDQGLADFGIIPDADLDVMLANQTLASLTSRLMDRLDRYLAEAKPAIVLAQGDTTTVFCAALACFYRGIPFGHVEAGLRTFDLAYPFPEEFNRVVTTLASRFHFAPTEASRANLLRERVEDHSIIVSGNTVIDALFLMRDQKKALPIELPAGCKVVLLTAHRRENFGAPLHQVFEAVLRLLAEFNDLHFVYPVHPNPHVEGMAREMLGGQSRVHLCAPLDYASLVALLDRCTLVLTDSGGLQEEAPALSKPVLVLRNETERPEAVELGVAKLIGTETSTVVKEVTQLLVDEAHYRSMAKGVSPYGDGKAAQRICKALEHFLEIDQST